MLSHVASLAAVPAGARRATSELGLCSGRLSLDGFKQLYIGASPVSVAQQGSLWDSACGVFPATAIDVGCSHLKALT